MNMCCRKAEVIQEGDYISIAWKTKCEDHGIKSNCYMCNPDALTTSRCRDCILSVEDFFCGGSYGC
jgi:hypothetical protein